jgi:two-component system cell cycle sensor histidine kinase/response regulator CckA
MRGGIVRTERDRGTKAEPTREELFRRCRELQLMVDAIPALVFYKDTKNGIVRVNRAVAESFGVSATEFPGTDTARWYPEQAEEHYRADLEVIDSKEPRRRVLEPFSVPGHGRRLFETTRLPQFDAEGRITGIVVVAQDTTDRRQLEDRLQQAQKLESIGRLAGGVAHDFNNLLTSIFGLITLAQRVLQPGSTAHEYLALLQLAAEGGANLTRQLLAFARRQMIAPKVVDLNVLVLETSTLLERVLGEDIEVVSELGKETLPVKVDPSQVSQLLLNLALNARDAMPRGGRLTFTTARVVLDDRARCRMPDLALGPHAMLRVGDTGEGMSDDARQHLFEPFFTTKAIGKGTGLGLATCYGVARQNGGSITLEPQDGPGTTFSIYLPLTTAAVEEARPAGLREPVQPGNETVLFVEDDDLLRHLTVADLASHGYRLIEASNGEEALRAAKDHAGPIHLLITDVVMPQMSGVELARLFREIRPDAKVLYISGYMHDSLPGPEPSAQILLKPFTSDVLLARVHALLDDLSADQASPTGQRATGP